MNNSFNPLDGPAIRYPNSVLAGVRKLQLVILFRHLGVFPNNSENELLRKLPDRLLKQVVVLGCIEEAVMID